ncbi:restriction endonuclease subunit S, partial [Lactobacillus acetotolerans]
LKKALMQNMFANKSLYPKLRFKGFTDKWKQEKLNSIASLLNGRAYKRNELLNSGKYPVLRVGNFYTNDKWYFSNLELKTNKYAIKGDLLYTWSATFGPHIWTGKKVIYHYHIWKIILKNNVDKFFVYEFLKEDRDQLLRNTNGSTMIHITKSNMENKYISLPNKKGQKKIGNFFKKFDNLIIAQNKKYNELKFIKKFLLQNMFI